MAGYYQLLRLLNFPSRYGNDAEAIKAAQRGIFGRVFIFISSNLLFVVLTQLKLRRILEGLVS